MMNNIALMKNSSDNKFKMNSKTLLDDFSSFFNRDVGLIDAIMDANINRQNEKFPPYDVYFVRDSDDEKVYGLEMAVAGYGKNDIDVELHNNKLTISGSKTDSDSSKDTERSYMYKGIAHRSFKQVFNMPKNSEVSDVMLKDGMLKITIKTVIPEEDKPKRLEIKTK